MSKQKEITEIKDRIRIINEDPTKANPEGEQDPKEDKKSKYIVLIGEDRFTLDVNSRYKAKKLAAEKFVKKHNLKDVVMSDITTFLANEYKLPDPKPKCTTEEAIKFLQKVPAVELKPNSQN